MTDKLVIDRKMPCSPKKQGWYRKWYEKRVGLGLPSYTLGEEIFSAVSHGVTALMGIAGLVLLLLFCRKEALTVVSCCVYAVSLIIMFSVSCIYHALGINKGKKVFQILDHCAIFLLIGGTYTPMSLIALGGIKGLILGAFVWTVAIVGIVLNCLDLKKYSKFSMVCYIIMGWSVIVTVKDFYVNAGGVTFAFLLAGGIVYTVGAVLYGMGKKIPYVHSVWHIFVTVAAVLQFVSVFRVAV